MAYKDVNEAYKTPDTLWEKMQPPLPPEHSKPKGGRPGVDNRVLG